MSEEIRIYVADLAAYNNGKLHGVWIDANAEVDDIWKAVNSMLASSPEEGAEEWAIHDYEGFGEVSLSEWESFERVREIALFLEETPAVGSELLNYYGGDLEAAKRAAEESYTGTYISLASYAEEWTDNTAEIPEDLAYYIDYERMGRDWELSGEIFTIEVAHDEVHVFWAH